MPKKYPALHPTEGHLHVARVDQADLNEKLGQLRSTGYQADALIREAVAAGVEESAARAVANRARTRHAAAIASLTLAASQLAEAVDATRHLLDLIANAKAE